MRNLCRGIALALPLFVTSVASAHPGHGGENGLQHYLLEPAHWPAVMLVLGMLAVAWRIFRPALHNARSN